MTALRRLAESLDLPEAVIDSVVRNPGTPLQITQFPAPPSPAVADMIEATAHNLLADYPYRTLLDCREVAARLVGVVLTWDSMWPEAEGDCTCTDADRETQPWHREGCPQWGLPL